MYAIVEFINDKSCSVIPCSWLIGESICKWPKHVHDISKFIKYACEPTSEWIRLQVKVIKVFETYDKARLLLAKSEETSALSSDAGRIGRGQRRKRIRKQYSPNADSTESDETYISENETPDFSEDLPTVIPPTQEMEKQINLLNVSDISGKSSRVILTREVVEDIVKQQECFRAELKELKIQNNRIESMLNKIYKKNFADEDLETDESLKQFFPVDESRWGELENYLISLQNRKKLIQKLLHIGGITLKDVVTRTLSFVFEKNIGKYVTWCGKCTRSLETKLALKDSALIDVLISVLERLKIRGGITDIKINCQWFLKKSYDKTYVSRKNK